MPEILTWFAYAGTAVFAISGALMGLRHRLDIIGLSFLATITGVGGGTLRDLLLGDGPVGWVQEPAVIAICVTCALLTGLLNATLRGRRMLWLLYADAGGLALFAVIGAAKAQAAGAHPGVSVLLGAMSASFGGVMRDLVCGEVPVLFRREIYVTAALAGGTIFVAAPEVVPFGWKCFSAFLVAFSLRTLALYRQWSLPFPRYRA